MTKRKSLAFALLALAVAPMAACQSGTSKGYVSVGAIDGPIDTVTERHDRYVRADDTLNETERSTALRTSELLRGIVSEAKKPSVP